MSTEEKHQQLLNETAQKLSEAVQQVMPLGGAIFKQGLAEIITPLCKKGVKVFGVDTQIEDEFCSAVEEIVRAKNSDGDQPKQNFNRKNLRWSIVVQELRSLKRKYPQQQQFHQQPLNNSNNNNILPPKNTPLGQALDDSFVAVHFLVETSSIVKEYGPGAISPILVNNLPKVRKEAEEWWKKQNEEENIEDEIRQQELAESLDMKKRREHNVKKILKAMYYHSSSPSLNEEKNETVKDDGEDSEEAKITFESSKSLLLSSEWLKVDSILLMKNGNFLRHPAVTDFFTCPPSLLSLFRRLKMTMMMNNNNENLHQPQQQLQQLQQVIGQLNLFRENKQRRLMALGGNSKIQQDSAVVVDQHQNQQGQTQQPQQENEKQQKVPEHQQLERYIPIKFIGSKCMDLVLENLAKVC